MNYCKKVLSIAGSDPSGGAGLQADIKVLSEMGVYAAGAVTALTRQTTQGVVEVRSLPPDWVGQQVKDVLCDLEPQGIKTGMLGNTATALAVIGVLEEWMKLSAVKPVLVVDPVLASGGGAPLYEAGGLNALLEGLFPLATLVTPNIPEAERLAGIKIQNMEEVKESARIIKKFGPGWVLIKGGHGGEDDTPVKDLLYDGREFYYYTAPRIHTGPLHGTGCCLSSCITASFVRGATVKEAVEFSTTWLRQRLAGAVGVGKGSRIVCFMP